MAIAAAVEVLGLDADEQPAFTREAASLDVTKSALDAAVKRRAAKGRGAATLRTIYDAIRARGGASRPTRRAVETYTIPPRAGEGTGR